MSPIYQEARRCFKAGEFTNMTVSVDADCGYATVISKDRRPLQTFVSQPAARAEMLKQIDKASKFIGSAA